MGTRFEMPVGESYTEGVVVVEGAIPTDPTTPGTIGLFIGDTILNSQTTTHLVTVAIQEAMNGMKNQLSNKGSAALLDRYRVREPLDPARKRSNDLTLATEDHIWTGFEGDAIDASSSQFLVGAMEKLIAAYREYIGVGKWTQTYVVPGGAIITAAGTYAASAVIDLTGAGVWRQGTGITIAGTTDAGSFGLDITTPKDMVLSEVAQHLSTFLKGWSKATFAYKDHPTDPNISSIAMLAFAGGLAVNFDSIAITPVP